MGMLLRIADNIPYGSHTAKIIDTLSQYTERVILDDGSVTMKPVYDNRFYRNAQWDLSLFSSVSQFRENAAAVKRGRNRCVKFEFPCENLNLEAKFVVYHKVFNEEWSISNTFGSQITVLSHAAKFIRERHPNLFSFLDLNIKYKYDSRRMDKLAGAMRSFNNGYI